MTINDRIERLESALSVLMNHIEFGNQDYAALVVSDMRRELDQLRNQLRKEIGKEE